jgi:hypothetical protein
VIGDVSDVGVLGLVVLLAYALVRALDLALLVLRNKIGKSTNGRRNSGNGSARMTLGPLDQDECKDCRETVKATNASVGRLAEVAAETHDLLKQDIIERKAYRRGKRDAMRETGEHPVIGG